MSVVVVVVVNMQPIIVGLQTVIIFIEISMLFSTFHISGY